MTMSPSRGLIAAAAAAILSLAIPGGGAAAKGEAMSLQDELAASHQMELRALRLLDDPRVRAACLEGEKQLRDSIPFVDPGSKAVYPQAMREIGFLAVLNAMSQDPEYPGILFAELPPRSVGGVALPGSRGLDDNPDTVYRFIPVDGHSHFVITGQGRANGPAVNEFSVLTDDWVTVGNVSGKDLVRNADGTFEITVDPAPANGRPNHIQTREGASYTVIRDTLADWSKEKPNLLAVRRIEPPSRPPLSDDALAEVSARYVRKWFAKTIQLHDMAFRQPANHFPQPEIRQTMGMLVTQAYSVGRFDLKPDEAVILTLKTGGAGYAVAPVTNLWGLTNDPVNQSASLNTSQAERNPDGSYSFVLSLKDPGIANWIDPGGLPQGFLFLRWAAIDPHYGGGDKPSVDSRLVRMSELATLLPAGLTRVDAAQRRVQLADRAAVYAKRWEAP